MSGSPVYSQVLTSQKAAGTLFNTYTTAKSVLNVTELVPLAGNTLTTGSKLRINAWGGISSTATTPGTVVFQAMLGSIVVWTSGLVQLSASANVLLPFHLEVIARVDTIGSGTTAKLMALGRLQGIGFQYSGTGANGTITNTVINAPITAPAVGTGFDSTVANILDFWVGFSTSSAGNGVQIYDYTVEQLQ